jgi:hypothetical protein
MARTVETPDEPAEQPATSKASATVLQAPSVRFMPEIVP